MLECQFFDEGITFLFIGISVVMLQDLALIIIIFFHLIFFFLKSLIAWIAVSYLLSGRENIGLLFSLPFLVTTDPAYVYLKGPAGFNTCDSFLLGLYDQQQWVSLWKNKLLSFLEQEQSSRSKNFNSLRAFWFYLSLTVLW